MESQLSLLPIPQKNRKLTSGGYGQRDGQLVSFEVSMS